MTRLARRASCSALAVPLVLVASCGSGDIGFRSAALSPTPAPPVLKRINDGSPPTIEGVAGDPITATVRFYSDASCSTATAIPDAAVAGGQFSQALPGGLLSTTIWARARTVDGVSSACSARGLPFYSERAGECAMITTSAPVTRAPQYAMWTLASMFKEWAKYCNRDSKSCPKGSELEAFFQQLAVDRPAYVGGTGTSAALHPVTYGLGPVGYGTDPMGIATERVYSAGDESMPTELTGQLDVSDTRTRRNELALFYSQWPPDVRSMPYTELGTQLYGNPFDKFPHSGIWKFLLDGDAAKFASGNDPLFSSLPQDPRSWLRAYSEHVKSGVDVKGALPIPQELDGLSYDHYPVSENYYKGGVVDPYNPVYRLSADILNPEYREWRKQGLHLLEKAGHRSAFIDNASFARCWNNDCEAAFHGWAASELAARYGLSAPDATALAELTFTRPAPSLVDGDFEAWLCDTTAPYACHGGSGANAENWSKLQGVLQSVTRIRPDSDAQRGFYSARFEVKAGDVFQLKDLPNIAIEPHTLTLRYRTDSLLTKLEVQVYDGARYQTTTTSIAPSTTWRTATVTIAPSGGISLRLGFPTDGTVWIDDVQLVPQSGLKKADTWWGWLYYKGALSHDDEWGGAARMDYSFRFWNAQVDPFVEELHAAAPMMSLVVNSPRQVRGADAHIIERGVIEAEGEMWEHPWDPGRYDAGTLFPGGVTLATRYYSSNALDYLSSLDQRLAGSYSATFHLLGNRFPVDGPNHPQDYAQNANTVELAFAEAAAFSGGAAVDLGFAGARSGCYPGGWNSPGLTPLRDAARNFTQVFAPANSDGLHCLQQRADVGIVLRSESRDAVHEQIRLFDELASQGLLVDVLGQAPMTADKINAHKLIVLHHVDRLSIAEAEALRTFVANGGAIITTSDTGRVDDIMRLREALPLANDGTRGGWWTDLVPLVTPAPPNTRIWVRTNTVSAADVNAAMTAYHAWASASAFVGNPADPSARLALVGARPHRRPRPQLQRGARLHQQHAGRPHVPHPSRRHPARRAVAHAALAQLPREPHAAAAAARLDRPDQRRPGAVHHPRAPHLHHRHAQVGRHYISGSLQS